VDTVAGLNFGIRKNEDLFQVGSAINGEASMSQISTTDTILDAPEMRFPIDLSNSINSVRDLFHAATKNQWDPRLDIPWQAFEKSKYSEEQLWAARNAWSRRAWLEYGAISESPAIQIRFARESREMDLGLFFTVRSQEEARHAEVCYLMAEACGGYIDAPPLREYEGNVVTHGVRKMALDPDCLLEALIAALVCAAEEVAFDVFKHLAEITTDPIAKACSRGIMRDEVRHCAFGWHYMAKRAPHLDVEELKQVEDAVAVMIQNVEMNGYHSSWLAQDDTEATRADVECDRITYEAGLGSTIEAVEKPIFIASVQRIRQQMRAWGCELPPFSHPRTGTI
jgi:hypothetical protein